MSIALVFETINDEEATGYFPIATEDLFVKYWIPISRKNNLRLLEYFRRDKSLTEIELPELINEVGKFRNALNNEENIPTDVLTYLNVRVTNLLNELKKLDGNKVKFFIG